MRGRRRALEYGSSRGLFGFGGGRTGSPPGEVAREGFAGASEAAR